MRRLIALAVVVAIGPASAGAQCLSARPGSPYDFAAGGSTLFQTEFSSDAVGEFPKVLEFKQGAMEVAEWQGKRALKASAPSALAVPLPAALPESFTVEVGVVNRNSKAVGAYTMKLYGGRNFLSDFSTDATRANYGTLGWEVSGGGASASAAFSSADAEACMGQEQTVRLQVDGARLKLYADERRLASVPNAQFLRARGIVIALEGRDDGENAVYLTRIRVAGGAAVATAPTSDGAPAVPATVTGIVRPVPTTTTSSTSPTASTTTAAPTPAGTTTAKTGATPIAGDGISKAATTGAAMTAPKNFGGVAVGGGKVQLVWSAVPDAVSYQVYYTTPTYPTPVPVNILPTTDTTLTTRQLNEGSVTLTVVANFGTTAGPKSSPVTLTIPRYMGKYRVAVLGFKVNNETFDNPVETDGKRDEVYITAAAQEFDSLDAPVGGTKSVRTFTYGDVNNPAWKNSQNELYRIKAGTAGTYGGLKTGDGYPNGVDPWRRTTPDVYEKLLPLLVWEGELVEDVNSVAIAPAIMESDDVPGTQVLTQFVASFGKGIAPRLPVPADLQIAGRTIKAVINRRTRVYSVASARSFHSKLEAIASVAQAVALGPLRGYISMLAAAEASYAPAFQAALASALIASNTKDRAVGTEITANGTTYFDPMFLSLTYETAEDIIAGKGEQIQAPGILALNYRDSFPGGIGNYTLYIEVKRMP